MKQYTENQYDDDLTVGTDDYDDSYYTGSVDLFEFSNDEESPISRLKSLILSIDWEITDEVLMQFNEELLDLRDIWAGEKINLVYVQALEKISKYIYQKKADSHPSAIKLLLTLYHNLEKIVSSLDLTEEQKKEILLEDVKRFESLKLHIAKPSQTGEISPADQQKLKIQTEKVERDNDLLNLKAIVLGIDWEITDQDLNELRQEVIRLEEKFADSRPRLILLQGIGTIGAYVKLKKSDAHADAFKILHLFYESLEKIVTTPMSIEEEKAILFPAVEQFNSFKNLLGPTIAPEVIKRDEQEEDDLDGLSDSGDIAPAFSDIPEEEIKGFQAEEEARALGIEGSDNVDNHVEDFFIGSSLESSEAPILADDAGTAKSEEIEMALQGVDVELDDEDEDDNGVGSERDTFAPALSTAIEGEKEDELSSTFQAEELSGPEEQLVPEDSFEMPVEEFSESSVDFIDEGEEAPGHDFSKLDRDVLLQGVDVETEADDDSDEEALPMMKGELAPALAENDEVSIFNAQIFEDSSETDSVDDEIAGTLGGFFDEEIELQQSVALNAKDGNFDIASMPVDSEIEENEIDSTDDSLPSFNDGPTIIEEQEGDGEFADDDFIPLATESVISPEEDEVIAFVSDTEQEEGLDLLFGDDDTEPNVEGGGEEDVIVEPFGSGTLEEEEASTEIDEQLESFFDLGETFGEAEDDTLMSSPLEERIEDIVGLEGKAVPAVSDDSEEDEVVFELAEDVEQLSDAESALDKDEETSFNPLLSVGDDVYSSELAAEDEEELTGRLLATLENDPAAGVYDALQTCVESLGIELDDKVILGLWAEIDLLNQTLADKPLEKTLLLLLSTITRHIDQNRYDSSSEAYILLQSVCRALSDLHEGDLHKNQKMLLAETSNVLKWQEKVLAEQISRNEAELTIGDSVLSDQGDVIGDFDELVQNYEEDQTVETYDRVFAQNELEEPARLHELQEQSSAGEDTLVLNDDLKNEISTLRQSLQDEIAELRNDLQGNSS